MVQMLRGNGKKNMSFLLGLSVFTTWGTDRVQWYIRNLRCVLPLTILDKTLLVYDSLLTFWTKVSWFVVTVPTNWTQSTPYHCCIYIPRSVFLCALHVSRLHGLPCTDMVHSNKVRDAVDMVHCKEGLSPGGVPTIQTWKCL